MDDGEVDFSNQEVFSNSSIAMDDLLPTSCSMDTFFDELMKDSHACTHTHTCNPPGPENTHTHTCLHVHTKILPAQSEDKVSTDETSESSEKSKKRPLGNREAVRKYREKKKAKAASLEDEVIRLRALNNQLLKRLQGQAVLEAENSRLKCLLVDIRGRIEGEIGAFPYQKPVAANLPFSYMMHPCNLQCDDDDIYCLQNGVNGDGGLMNNQGKSDCDFDQLQCLGSQNSLGKEIPVCSHGNGHFNANSTGANKRKGGPRAAKAV